jgi:hypothetical protein
LATSFGGVPEASSFRADWILLSVIRCFLPPVRPKRRAASNPAQVHSSARRSVPVPSAQGLHMKEDPA